jgi:hypothetical protein
MCGFKDGVELSNDEGFAQEPMETLLQTEFSGCLCEAGMT